MTRIDDENPSEKDMIIRTFSSIPKCMCRRPATIWVRPGDTGLRDDLFICDRCGLQLARIILNDLGHPLKIVRNPVYRQ